MKNIADCLLNEKSNPSLLKMKRTIPDRFFPIPESPIPIFTVDIHPDMTRFATGGQGEDGGLIVLWSMAPVLSERTARSGSVPKSLSRLENHSGKQTFFSGCL